MASCRKVTKGELVLWQTLSPSALAAPVSSLRTVDVLSLQRVLIIGVGGTSRCPDSEVAQELTKGIPRSRCPTLPWGLIRDVHIYSAALSLPHA